MPSLPFSNERLHHSCVDIVLKLGIKDKEGQGEKPFVFAIDSPPSHTPRRREEQERVEEAAKQRLDDLRRRKAEALTGLLCESEERDTGR